MKKKLVLTLLVAAFAFFILPVNKLEAQAASLLDQGIIRVKISAGSSGSTTVKSYGNYVVSEKSSITLEQGKVYTICVNGDKTQLKNAGGTVLYEGSTITLKQYSQSSSSNYIYVYNVTNLSSAADRSYQGDLVFKKYDSELGVYNYINLDKYVEGVLALEVSNSWPMEALKAQAVAARSYAYARMNVTGTYDVVDTTTNQAYGGYCPSNTNITSAVNATKRQVLYYGGKVISTYFSSSNGGQTEKPATAWFRDTASARASVNAGYAYLQLKKDEYDLKSPNAAKDVSCYIPKNNDQSSTNNKFGSSSFENHLKLKISQYLEANYIGEDKKPLYSNSTENITINKVTSITPNTLKAPEDTTSLYYTKIQFGLNITVKLVDGNGATNNLNINLNLDALDVRNNACSTKRCLLPSVTTTSTGYTITFRRYGHGVGLSQYGTYERAKAGQSYRDILNFYFTGVTYKNLTYPDFSIPNNGSPATSAPATPTPTPTPKPSSSTKGTAISGYVAKIVNVSSAVNVRSGPGTNYGRLGTAKKGSTWALAYKDVPGTDGKKWYQITYNGKTGYIRSDYIQLVSTSSSGGSSSSSGTAISGYVAKIVNVSSAVNVRSGPGTNYGRIGTAKKSSTWAVTYKDVPGTRGKKWYRITYNGKTGYVRSDYIQLVSTGSSSSPGSSGGSGGSTGGSSSANGTAISGYVAKIVNVSSAVNVRSGPGTNYGRIGTARKSTTWTVTYKDVPGTRGKKWYKITYNGKAGYIRSDYIQLVSKSSSGSSGGSTGGSSSSSGTAISGYLAKVVNVSSAVNVRSGPGTNYGRIGTARKSTTWTVTYKDVPGTAGKKWYKISYSGKTGYIRSDYIQLVSKTSSGSTSPSSGTAINGYLAKVVNVTSAVNVRSGPGTNYSRLGTAKKSSTWTVTYKDVTGTDGKKWYKISYSGKTGYIRSDYIQLVSKKSSSSSTNGTAISGYLAKVINVNSAVNVRSGPGTNYSRLGTAKLSSTWNVTYKNAKGTNGKYWYKITYNGKTGYIRSDYIQLVS